MKILFLLSLFAVSCINNEGDISVKGNIVQNNPNEPNTQDPNTEDPVEESENNESNDPSSSQSEILIDFTDSNEIDNHFTTYLHDASFTQENITALISSSAAGRCTNAGTNSSCNFKTIQTFNLPITYEIEVSAYNLFNSGTRWGVALYQGVASRWSAAYDNPNGGTNYGAILWEYIGNNYIKSWGIFGENSIGSNLSNHGKLSVSIQADGSYTITYTQYDNSGNYLNEHTTSSTLSVIPQNFHLEFYQMNYSGARYHDIDNIRIVY